MSQAPALSQTQELTRDQVNLIKATVAKGATDDELRLFLYRAQHLGLDPLKPGQIHFIKYGNSPGTIVVGIEGFRAIAERTGKRAGIKRGVIRDADGLCIGAWCEVYRSDWKEPAREEVSLTEYNTGKGPWAKMPETMIKKVAEAAALRMAFSETLGGVYIREEMDQAENEEPIEAEPTPAPEVGRGGDFRITFGKKFNGKLIREVPENEIEGFLMWAEDDSAKKGKPISNQVRELKVNFERYMNEIHQPAALLDADWGDL